MFSQDISSGLLNLLSPSTIANPSFPCGIVSVNIDTKCYIYTIIPGAPSYYGLSVFGVDISGQLIPLATYGIVRSPRSIAIASINNKSYVYVVSGSQRYILVYTINNSSGLLTQTNTITTGIGNSPSMIVTVTINTNAYAYVNNVSDNTISMYSINSAGAFTYLGNQSIGNTLSGAPRSMAINKINIDTYNLYVLNNGNNTITNFSINNFTGSLTLVSTISSQVATPYAIAFANITSTINI
jgi:6-phosphogluconolactonase (cycloisomerase 2 family)